MESFRDKLLLELVVRQLFIETGVPDCSFAVFIEEEVLWGELATIMGGC